MLSRSDAKKLVASVVAMSKADEVSVSLRGGDTTHLRFARNSPSTSGAYSELSLVVRSSFGKRSAAATVNQTDEATLRQAVSRSEEIARLAPEDPEHMPALGATDYPTIDAFDDETAKNAATRLARGVATNIGDAKSAKLVVAGFGQARAGFAAIGNSAGLFGYHSSTDAYIGETVRTTDNRGSGWAAAASPAIGSLDFAGVSSAAIGKAKSSVGSKPLEPGKYVTILEPACVANLVRNMMWSMDARSADEGRSFFSKKDGGNRIGERVFPENINIVSDPANREAPMSPWGGEHLPQKRRAWIENGVVRSLATSRYWAKKTGTEAVPGPGNVIMSGGTGSVDELIKSTKKGVLITSLWYIRSLDPQTLTYTGLTRDGVFWIEDGEIRHPVTNFRWNDSPIAILKNAVAMSAPTRTPPRPSRAVNVIVPAIKTSSFHLASVSDAI